MDTITSANRPESPDVRVHPPMVPAEPMWEYQHLVRQIPPDRPLDESTLNAMGEDGWELTGVVAVATAVHYYFKRPTR